MTSTAQDKTQTGTPSNGRRRPRARRNQRCWSPRQLNAKSRNSPVRWTAAEWLRPWKESSNNTRYFYGTGSGQVLLEREEDEGVWKVSRKAEGLGWVGGV